MQTVPRGTVVWSFSPLFDRPINEHVYTHAPKNEQFKLFQRGFRNPHAPSTIVLCSDEAQFLNFPRPGDEPNVAISGVIDGYDILVASKDLDIGEELLVPPESDADYAQKVLSHEQGHRD